MRKFGVAPSVPFARAGVPLRLFKNPENRTTFEALGRLFEECATATSCDHFGLLVGECFELEGLGDIGYLMRNSATVGEALRALLLHLNLHDPQYAHVALLHLARRLWRDRLPSRTLANLEVQILGAARTEEDIPARGAVWEYCGANAVDLSPPGGMGRGVPALSVGLAVDGTPPVVESFTLSPSVLPKAHHRMVEIKPTFTANDPGGGALTFKLLKIDYRDFGGFDRTCYDGVEGLRCNGPAFRDISVDSRGKIWLRAERDSRGTGRVYTVTGVVLDEASKTGPAFAKFPLRRGNASWTPPGPSSRAKPGCCASGFRKLTPASK